MKNKLKTQLDAFDHVVVLMLENRSFDNLLGHLYDCDETKPRTFEGLTARDPKENTPFKKWTEFGLKEEDLRAVQVKTARDYHQPYPDPGEEYQHVNSQKFNFINDSNFGKNIDKMEEPNINIPSPIPESENMNGFLNDYINTLLGMPKDNESKEYQPPSRYQFEVIMQCFKPFQVDVLSQLAKEFAVFDHWFASVPSQTWCNRAFWHAGTSGGFVNNPMEGFTDIFGEKMGEWTEKVWSAPNLFTKMKEKSLSAKVYVTQIVSLTALINGPKDITIDIADNVIDLLNDTNNLTNFKADIKNKKLPKYSFVEPKFMLNHNDQHPSAVNSPIYGKTNPGTVLRGEDLIWEVYDSIFTDEYYKDNTLLIITHDEHGGCYDHVKPVSVSPPNDGNEGKLGFDFSKTGIRVPMVMVSANIRKNTIINDVFDHSSFLKTMCKKWNLTSFTDRDKNANSFESVFTMEKRTNFPKIDRPDLTVEDSDNSIQHEMPLNDLQKTILNASQYLASKKLGLNQLQSKQKIESINTIGEAMTYLESIQNHLN